jgi:UDP-N-acetylmuramoyl-tripeptide--D-alanyl-D-alanine ligase
MIPPHPPLWTAADLVNATGGGLSGGFEAAAGVSIDSRTVAPGDLFIALVTETGDGHAHARAALDAGAAGVMVHRDAGLPAGAPVLRVDDTQAGLIRLGAYARARFAGRLVAVTGSVGKTTTKEMLRTALAAQGRTHAAHASYNNHWGVPLTLARLPRDAAWCVVEIGMNHGGEIAPLARLARPLVGVITAIERAHIGHLGSIEAIADEKAALVAALDVEGTAILPADSPHLPRLLAAAPSRAVTFGRARQADARLLEAQGDADGTTIAARINDTRVQFRLPVPGSHMALNAVAALAAVAALGADPRAGAAALTGFAAVAGRGHRRTITTQSGPALLLDESYNASAAAVRAALEVLALQPAARRLAVLGDMLELGSAGPAEHAGLAAAVADSADLLFACGPLSRHLFDAVPPHLRAAHAPDAAALAPLVRAAVRGGDAVLVKGSLGSRMGLIVAALDAG